jgi:hypothetical protein
MHASVAALGHPARMDWQPLSNNEKFIYSRQNLPGDKCRNTWLVQWESVWPLYGTVWVRFPQLRNFAKFEKLHIRHPCLNHARRLLVTSDLEQVGGKLEQVSCILKLYKACLCISINIKTRVETPRQLDKKWGSRDRLLRMSLCEYICQTLAKAVTVQQLHKAQRSEGSKQTR